MKKAILMVFICFGVVSVSFSQKINDAYRLNIRKTVDPIVIDGKLDEQSWTDAEVATDFFMITPMDTSFAEVRTDVRMAYDDKHLYLIVVNYHALEGPYMVESLRRDFSFGKNDNFLLFMDPFDDQINGFSFGANAAGAQWDGIMYDGGKVDLSWDNKWESKVTNYDDRWVFEASIPFKSIRYKSGIKEWGINFSRLDLKTTEKSGWAPVPRQFPSASLAYTGILVWDNPPPAAGPNISVIPYGLGGHSQNRKEGEEPIFRNSFGMDAKIGLGSALNLDLTVNPDFSQVEVDKQVTNLDRFELFFPERRQFFLENGDLFANFGYETIRPFFSRRIGLKAPIQAGARLSGKLNKDWRIGAMTMQTGQVEEENLDAQNFSVLTLQRRVLARSNLSAIAVTRQAGMFTPPLSEDSVSAAQFDRNVGLEFNYASSNNLWTGKAFVLKSFNPLKPGQGLVYAANLRYTSGNLYWNVQHEYVSENYTAEVGYVPRTGFYKINPLVGYLFFPESKKILSHGPEFSTKSFFDTKMNQTDNETYVSYKVRFRTQSVFTTWVAHDYIKLLNPFDPTNFSGDTLAAGSEHRWFAWGTEFTSKPQSIFTYALATRVGGYYAEGNRYNISGELGYRFQPYFSMTMNANYNEIHLTEPWGITSFWLVGPRFDLTLTNKFFITAFVQYNEQVDNINLNTRIQWRFKPASDIFLVFTDNYLPAPFFAKNRSVALKFTYWWNI
ncbi:carbohydrate binding family 9 domain-containing protein [Aquiflexum sp. LQ15W]|uniref:DUF5916 domain-containing protein n=1 Tax=Cognataquiflexum nitidum TaxID=2922272 RepID=UPI001F13D734|nr:DUF5916 domain-containing protein [Cognataquiflexum nitidum]MCH6198291.1 carbohydrate binding family 9 domain-containing protein [Cognataquiflexum nitidum]